MSNEVSEVMQKIQNMASHTLDILDQGTMSAEEVSVRVLGMSDVFRKLEKIVPSAIYDEYKEFFDTFYTFCRSCSDVEFLTQQVDNLVSSLILFVECMEEMKKSYSTKVKRCAACGSADVDIYWPLPSFYDIMEQKYGTYKSQPETLNYIEYNCRYCGSSDRDRLIISFLEKAGLQKASEHTRLLQIAPAMCISNWIEVLCPQIKYDTTDMYMENVTFQSDIMDMNVVSDGFYDVIVCSHVLEHVRDDRKALSEMKRILKPDGKIVFLVPVDLSAERIDEEWGLSEAENWRRFGQGDHCRRYNKAGLMQRLEEQFCVHALDKDYFGEEVFWQCGLTDTSTLYVLTKTEDISLDIAKEIAADEIAE